MPADPELDLRGSLIRRETFHVPAALAAEVRSKVELRKRFDEAAARIGGLNPRRSFRPKENWPGARPWPDAPTRILRNARRLASRFRGNRLLPELRLVCDNVFAVWNKLYIS